MQYLKKAVREHPLIHTLLTVKGNPKVLLLMEPLWGLPFFLIAPFVTLYMQAQGISDIEIGLLLSAGTAIQVVCSSLGGILTDKYGRKKMTMIGDFFGWSLPCLIWSISGSFWLFFLATAFNSMEQVNQTAWVCLLNEDAEPDQIVHIWNWVLIAGQISLFFAPISGLFIRNTSVITVMRVLYLIFAIFMMIKNVVTYRYVNETKQGKIRMAECKGQSIFHMLLESKKIIRDNIKNKATILTLFVMLGIHCTTMVTNNFFALYATSSLGIAESVLAIFPIFRAAVMLIFFFAAPKILDKISMKIPMVVGLAFYTLCQVMLILCEPENLAVLFVYAFVDAVAFALVVPRKEAMMVYFVNEQERARILSLLLTITLLISTPFGYIAGKLSSMNRQYPFYLNTVIFAIMAVVLLMSKMKKGKQSTS
jgi:Major Facilitator Superfamily.